MPSRPWPLWLLTVLTLISFPVISVIYYTKLLESGALPTDADSIGIPIGGDFIFTVLISPVVFGVTWFCLRRYNPKTRLMAWRYDRSWRSIIATLIFGGGALVFSYATYEALSIFEPRFEHLWAIFGALATLWFLAMRAAVIAQLDKV